MKGICYYCKAREEDGKKTESLVERKSRTHYRTIISWCAESNDGHITETLKCLKVNKAEKATGSKYRQIPFL